MTDYITNKQNCMSLADKIKNYWHEKGFNFVDVWVETVPVYHNGDRIATRYEIASNIVQRVPQLS